MRPYEVLFWASIYATAGIFVAGIGATALQTVFLMTCAVCLAAYLRDRKRALTASAALILIPLIGAGFFYVHFHAALTKPLAPPPDSLATACIVFLPERREKSASLRAELYPPYRGEYRLLVPPHAPYGYGDLLSITVERSLGSRGDLLVVAEAERVGDCGNPIRRVLLTFRARAVETLGKILPGEKAALAAGFLVGDESGFSDGLRADVRETGTAHIVALSGQNILYVVRLVYILAGWCLAWRQRFWATAGAVLLFVGVTGGEASVVRAAIMGLISLTAPQIGRRYAAGVAIAAAAGVMSIADPTLPAGDLGFQLSFAALIGIMVLKPRLESRLGWSGEPGFAGWRDILLMTTSAQVAVLPVLLLAAREVSWYGIIPNLLIVPVVGYATILSGVAALLGTLSDSLGLVASIPLHLLLGYALGVIAFFARAL